MGVNRQKGSIMSPSTIYRTGGVALILGCVVMVAGSLIIFVAGSDLRSTVLASGWVVWAIGAMLVAFGLPAAYAYSIEKTGLLGLAGFVGITLFLFTHGIFLGLLQGLALPVVATKAPAVGNHLPAAVGLAALTGALLLLIGSLGLGIATLRASVFPRGAGVLIIVGGLAVFIGHPLLDLLEEAGYVLLLAGLSWFGVSLLGLPPRPGTVARTVHTAVQ